jgi:hypothetical protein
MPFLKIVKNLRIPLIAFFIIFALCWPLFKDKKPLFKCTLEISLGENCARFAPDLESYVKALKGGVRGQLAGDRIALEKTDSDNKVCARGLEQEAERLGKTITEEVRKQQEKEALLLDTEIDMTARQADDLKAGLE